ncbi:hypothetical protein ACFL0H_12855 [Thermodesulfobacteriota bacterium]
MKIDCQEHSKSMELLSLKMQLEKGISDPDKLTSIKKRIAVLQKELELD